MEKSFDFGSMLKKHQKSHKSKPMQFQSVAGGVYRRLENNLKHRKSTRLTSFDHIRNISQLSPEPVPETSQKNPERRRQQLEKWKEEKENKKKLQAAQKKKKPFIATAAQQYHPLKYVPPPPVKPIPSTSGCVTRSQARNKEEKKQPQPQSFAPKNAGFRAPVIKTLTKMPKLAPPKSKKEVATSYTFNPVISAAKPVAMQTRSRAYNRIVAESKQSRSNTKNTKPIQASKPVSKVQKGKVQSSSSSETEPMQTSSSSSNVDLTAKIVSSSSEDNTDGNYSTGNDTSRSLKSLQSSSGEEQSINITPRQKMLHFTSSSESEKESPRNKQRKSLNTSQTSKSKYTPNKSAKPSESKRNSIPKSESSSEEKLRSPKSPQDVPKSPHNAPKSSPNTLKSPLNAAKSPQDVPMTPEQVAEEFRKISPCVTMSRGKDNARKEMKKKMEEGLFEEDESDMESVEHFQRQLSSEIARITEMCDKWDTVQDQVALPDTVQELVLAAVGQARLLMSQKMQQFASLVQRCARPDPAAPLVTPADLRGFWDMVFMQVENVDMRFKKLEELRARDWVEDKPAVAAARRAGPAPAPAPRRPAARAAPPSRLRDIIAAARKAKAQQAEAPPAPEEKTFEAGFFSVRSPARSPAPRTPAPRTPRDSASLLKAVLSSEAEKASASKASASFAMLRASVLGKNVECDGVEPLPQTPAPVPNLLATPGRSILKHPQDSSTKQNKQLRVVLFNDITLHDLDTSTEELYTRENNNNTNSKKDLTPQQNKVKENRQPNTLKDTNTEEKGNATSKLVRQNGIDLDNTDTENKPDRVMTRRMRKSMISPQTETNTKEVKTPRSERAKRSSKKEVLNEIGNNIEEEKTPRRSVRRRKTDLPSVG